MDLAEAFGEVLKTNRQKKGLSQSDLARQSGFDRTFISLLERGLRQPSLLTVYQLAEPLDVDAAELVTQVTNLRGRKVRRRRS